MKSLTILLLPLLLASATASAQDASPNEWLDRMSLVVASTDFEGTVIRRRNGHSQALKVVRRIVDGTIEEKLVSQEGSGLEIIRKGTEVYCVLPDKKSVLVESWDADAALFSTLPSSNLQFGSEYDLSIVREERVAGRRAMLLAVRPHDGYRYGHRIWLDTETGFPLRTELVGGDGALLEQLKFADVKLNPDISGDALEPSFDLQEFTWYPEPVEADAEEIDAPWVCDDLPRGFRQVSATSERVPDAASPLIHLMYSDGIANVSVFIAEQGDGRETRPQGVLGGPSNSHSVESGQHMITAIGEVPPATVRRIAVSMRPR